MPTAVIELEDGRKVRVQFDAGGDAAPRSDLDQTVRNFGRGVAQGATSAIDGARDMIASGGPFGILGAFPPTAGPVAAARAAQGLQPGGLEQIVDRNVVSLEPEGTGAGFRTGQSVGRTLPTLPVTGALGGLRAVGGDLALGAAGGAVAERVRDATQSDAAGNAAEIVTNLAPTAIAGLTRRAFRNGAGQLTIADELRDRAITGVDTGVGPATQGKTVPDLLQSVAEKVPGGTARISEFYQRTARAMQGAVDRYAGLMQPRNRPTDSLLAGRTVQRGIEGYANRVQQRMAGLVRSIGVSPGAQVDLTSTRAALEAIGGGATGIRELDMLSTTPAAAAAAQAARQGGAWQPVRYEQAIRLRALIGAKIANAGLIADVPRGELRRLYGALSQDIGAAVQASGGPDAYARFAQSQRYWEREMGRINDTLERIAERVPIERLVQTVQSSPQTLAVLRRTLRPDEFDTVVSATFSQLGTARNAAQNAAGDVFSLETFLTNWNRLGKQSRAVLLGGQRYREVREGLEAVARQTERMREIQARIANPSQTARGMAGNTMLAAVATGVATGQAWPVIAAGLTAGGANAAARLMTSPKFLRWLGQSTRVPTKQIPGMAARLTGMIDAGAFDPEAAAVAGEIAVRLQGVR